ncbi:hypothetical protein BH23CHL8_BH23CHL8_25630 [soil metagenome]
MVTCPNCGTANPTERAFCQRCGEELPTGAEPGSATRAATAGSRHPPAPRPQANPAFTALYDIAVLRNVQTAADALQGDQPDARTAFDAIREAMLALRSLADAEIVAYSSG